MCLGDGSTGKCGGSRLRFRWAKTECLSTGDRGEPDREAFCTWVMVLVEGVRDIGAFTESQRVQEQATIETYLLVPLYCHRHARLYAL